MSPTSFFMIWPSSPTLSILIWLTVAIVLLYLARTPAHQAIKSFSRVIYNAMRLSSRSIIQAEKKLMQRNREVLLSAGLEASEQMIESEFYRVNTVVQRDLHGYPALHRTLADQITRIDEDYRESTEVPPSPPGWVKAVDAVAQIPSTGDTMVGNILKQIHSTLVTHHKDAMENYRKESRERHALLSKMMPYWRKLSQTIDQVGKTITGLQARASAIDTRMAEYEEIRSGTDKAVRKLSSSSMTQFIISGLILCIAIGGAMINFNLIALPMSEMVGGGSYIGNYKMSDVAALVIILFEASIGIFLMESLRITHLFPIIGTMEDKKRFRWMWASLALLVIFACIEASLAFMRDMIAADMQALRQSLAAVEVVAPAYRWIPTVGQMTLGFILPFALTFVAIPLESFVHSSRTVMGVVFAGFLKSFAFLLRLIGGTTRSLSSGLINLYDLIIFPTLWIEKLIRDKVKQGSETTIGPKEEATQWKH